MPNHNQFSWLNHEYLRICKSSYKRRCNENGQILFAILGNLNGYEIFLGLILAPIVNTLFPLKFAPL